MPLDIDALRPSGAILAADIALAAAIEQCAVGDLGYDPTSLDLLVRLDLSPTGRLRAVDLCDQLLKSPSHISRLLDRVEEQGLVDREPDPDDRRASLVAITDAGRAVVADFGPRLLTVLNHAIHNTLTKAEIATLVDLLARVEQAARACPVPEEG